MARLVRRLLPWLLFAGLLAAAYFWGRDYVRKHPQDVPWTELRLDDPIGRFTLRKLAALADDPAQCRALLRAARSGEEAAPARSAGADCGYTDGLRLAGSSGEARLEPSGPVARCPVAAAMLLLERQVIQPAAQRHFGSEVDALNHAGTYSCRRLYGRSEGGFSEHAGANAIDITGFRLRDGTEISVLRDWSDGGAKGAFLRDIRDGACRLFATTLTPDYNEAHRDHFHLDQASRGRSGWGMCR